MVGRLFVRLFTIVLWVSAIGSSDSLSLTSRTREVPRRKSLDILFGLPVTLLGVQPSYAAAPTTVGETLRTTASKLPSSYYGTTDIFYPNHWKGKWVARRTNLSTGTVVVYNVRFVASIEDNSTVADRAFNQLSLEGEDASVEWTETNPNILRINYQDGRWKELKVTQRATEREGSNVFSSEVYRVTKQDSSSGVPNIVARRVMTKWKEVSPDAVEGLELIYDLQGEPTLLSKTSISLRR